MLRRLLPVLLTAQACLARVSREQQATALEACGLPDPNYGPTRHCFVDSTHHTCCMLGPRARAYSDNSGNPIGTAASKALAARRGHPPAGDELAPWCTCFGSLVCSYYAELFDDGTHVAFVHEPNSDPVAGALDVPKSRECEDKVRQYFAVEAHGTPGVAAHASGSQKCPGYTVEDHMANLFDPSIGEAEA